MTATRGSNSTQAQAAMPTVSTSTHNASRESNAIEAPTSPAVPALSSSGLLSGTQPDDTPAKEINDHTTSVTANSSCLKCTKKQRRSLWGSLCALFGPDLEGYTREELDLEEFRSNVECAIVGNYFMRLFPVFVAVTAVFLLCMLMGLMLGGHHGTETRRACVQVTDHVCNCGGFGGGDSLLKISSGE